ncbi:MAG: GGDEF domain-containing protein [Spirochaetales bacterium]|nr:GGDEF domain-containing protein [Spirochaetales bacterium]
MMEKSLTIGFHCERLIRQGYFAELLSGIMDATAEAGHNLLIFPAIGLNAPDPDAARFNIVLDFTPHSRIDGLLIASGMIGNYITHGELNAFYEKFQPLPMVSIGIRMKKIPSITVDNLSGITQAVTHLVTVHGRKRIAFLSGPQSNEEALVRLEAYRSNLRKHGLPVDEELIYFGDFRFQSGYDGVYSLLKKRKIQFDAVIAANDEMALGGSTLLSDMGYTVPDDVAVIGFDDAEVAQLNLPPITSVRQPVYELGGKALKLLLNIINGKENQRDIILPTQLVVRESCGCPSRSLETIKHNVVRECQGNKAVKKEELIERMLTAAAVTDKKGLRKVINRLEELITGRTRTSSLHTDVYNLFQDFLLKKTNSEKDINKWHILVSLLRDYFLLCSNSNPDDIPLIDTEFHKIRSQVILVIHQIHNSRRNQLATDFNELTNIITKLNSSVVLTGTLKAIQSDLRRIDINSCCIYLYEKDDTDSRPAKPAIPEKAELVMAFADENLYALYPNGGTHFIRDIFPNPIPTDRKHAYVIKPLFFMEDHFGFMIFELGQTTGIIYETLWLEISAALKTILLFRDQKAAEEKLKKALNDLEAANRKLHDLSQQDELTGLYNRRGFMILSESRLKLGKRLKQAGILFYGDLDNLKEINDTFGHQEGDWAIAQAGYALKRLIRPNDLLARIGGDEFLILCMDPKKDWVDNFNKNIAAELDSVNAASGKQFSLSITFGSVLFRHDTNLSVDKIINQADIRLYEQKKSKKGGRDK